MKFIFFLLFSVSVLAQDAYPKNYFIAPLDIPLLLSGNFGELRSNHFHTGLDFKTQQKEGFKVYAAAEGYISRIKISSYGYGKAIYITHPNGFTTVYGHLLKANQRIEAYIKGMHYKEQSYEIEFFPKPNELAIKKGDVIAFSGNTGGSGGPHLHFEIRDTKTEKAINPMFFGFDTLVADTKSPIINGLIAYPVGDNAVVNESQRPISINLSLQKDGSYISEKVFASGKIGFAVNAYDIYNFTYNKNGLYKVQAFNNGKSLFAYAFDSFSFDETRFINALLDYPRLKNTGSRFQKLFMINPYPLSIIRTNESNGIIDVTPNLTNIYKIEISDFNGNKVIVNVPIIHSKLPSKIGKSNIKTNYFLKVKNDNNYKKDNFSVFIPAKTFYEDTFIKFNVNADTLTFADDTFAIQNNIAITFEDTITSPAARQKMFIASVEGKKITYNTTKSVKNEFISYTKKLGKFVIAKDTVDPKITPINIKEGKWLSAQTNIQLSINDALSGIKSYNGYLNGKWVLFEYDHKSRKITHHFDSNFLEDGKNDLKVIVSDNVGNSAIFETHFFRKK